MPDISGLYQVGDIDIYLLPWVRQSLIKYTVLIINTPAFFYTYGKNQGYIQSQVEERTCGYVSLLCHCHDLVRCIKVIRPQNGMVTSIHDILYSKDSTDN